MDKVLRRTADFIPDSMCEINEIKMFIPELESVSDKYHSVNIRARHVFGENYAALFAEKFLKASKALKIGIDHGKSRAAQIFEMARTAEQSRVVAEQDRLLVVENKLANIQRFLR